MTRKVHYLGKPRSGAWAHPPRKTPPPPNQDAAPVATIICLCLVVLATLGAVAWGWSLVNVHIADLVEVGVDVD